MPSAVELPIRAYAHCVNSRCPGNKQQPVDAIVTETSYFYSEVGGDGMFGHPERSMRHLRFADPEQSHCECGANRDLSETPRIQLDDSGHDPGALLDIAPEMRDPEGFRKGSGHTVIDDSRQVALEAENNDLKERLARLEGYVMGQQSQEPVVEEPIEEPTYEQPADEEQEEPEA
jgi:hypothetical protein